MTTEIKSIYKEYKTNLTLFYKELDNYINDANSKTARKRHIKRAEALKKELEEKIASFKMLKSTRDYLCTKTNWANDVLNDETLHINNLVLSITCFSQASDYVKMAIRDIRN